MDLVVRRGKKSNLPASVNVAIDNIVGDVASIHANLFDSNPLLQAVLLKHGKSGGGAYDSGGIDVLLKANDKSIYNRLLDVLYKHGYLIDNLASGSKKYNGICRLGKKGIARRIDIMYTTPEQYPFSILYFTGSDNYNKQLRKDLNNRGMKINEYELKYINGAPITTKFTTEEDIFNFLNIEYVVPKNRL